MITADKPIMLNRTKTALKKCNKILLVGTENAIYKVFFYTDDFRYIVFELGNRLSWTEKFRFYKVKESDYNFTKNLNLTKEYSREDAYKLLSNCVFERKPDPFTLEFVLELLS